MAVSRENRDAREPPRTRRRKRDQGIGLGIDASGGPVIDPTENVIALVTAGLERQDELRAAGDRFLVASVQHLKEVADLRSLGNEHASTMRSDHSLALIQLREQLSSSRVDCAKQIADMRSEHDGELQALESAHVRELLVLRATYDEKLSGAETKRLDAVRAQDQLQVQTTANQASAAITTLANTTQTAVEAIRNAMESKAATVATQYQSDKDAMNSRVSKIEQEQYRNLGRSTATDPQIEQLIRTVDTLASKQSQTAGRDQGVSTTVAFVIGAVAFIAALAAIGTFLFAVMHH